MPGPVSKRKINIAEDFGLQNVEDAAEACRVAGLPFWAACALLEKESGGKNVWGGADASPFVELHDRDIPITKASFAAFYVGVRAGLVPTGVGPCQITYAGGLQRRSDGSLYRDGGYFRIMAAQGLRPWIPLDNMEFGFSIMYGHYLKNKKSWVTAGRLYNGALAYGEDYEQKCRIWKGRVGVGGPLNP